MESVRRGENVEIHQGMSFFANGRRKKFAEFGALASSECTEKLGSDATSHF